jgi:hypothetical protein
MKRISVKRALPFGEDGIVPTASDDQCFAGVKSRDA